LGGVGFLAGSCPLATGRAFRTARVGHEVAVSVLGVAWSRPASCWC